MDILLKGGTVVSPQGSKKADVRITGETIKDIGDSLESSGATVYDVTGKLLFPGFIDTHTHFDLDAGDFFTSDDFTSGTKAAIAGGTTTVLDHTTQNKKETLKEALSNWHVKADNKSYCDYGFHMSICDWNEKTKEEIQDMTSSGVTSYKLYMAYDNLKVNEKEIFEILRAVNEVGGIIGVHCEIGDDVKKYTKILKEQGNLSPKAHPLSRPDDVEAEAVRELLQIAKKAGVPVNIVHLSTKKGYDIVKKAREEGQKVYVESCPQYFLFDDSKYELDGFESAKYVLSPPLRKKEDIKCLWEAIKENKIDTIGTDHCSFNYKGQKERGRDDFSRIPNGIPGVEHRPALMYTYGVERGKITKEQMCATLSTNAAKLFGMYPKKGIIEIGSDADIVVWDTNYKATICAKEQVQQVDYTPYEGIEVLGRAEMVFLRGNLVSEKSQVKNETLGKFIYRGKSQDTF